MSASGSTVYSQLTGAWCADFKKSVSSASGRGLKAACVVQLP